VEYDGQYIVSGSSDQSIKVWDANTGECIHTLLGHTDLVRTLQLNSKTKTIVSGSYDGSLKIWNLEEGKVTRTLNQTLHGRYIFTMVLQPLS
jgi:WD40 repeat protein